MTSIPDPPEGPHPEQRLRRHRLSLYLVIGVLVVAVLGPPAVFIGSAALHVREEHAKDRPFDSAVWKASLEAWKADFEKNGQVPPIGADPIRRHMVDDLLKRHPLVGMSRADVESLLGIPPRPGYFEEYDLVYWLGMEVLGLDYQWLVIRFGADGRVTEARVLND